MLRAALLVLAVLLAGCTQPTEGPAPPQSAFVFVASRIDTTGDGLYDTVNVTLVAAPAPIDIDRLVFRLDNEELATSDLVDGPAWRTGTSVRIACAPGVHRVEVLVDEDVKKLLLAQCGVAIPVEPPSFQGAIIDGDADGSMDAIELTLIAGGPVDPRELSARMDDTTLRLYADLFKSRLARGVLANGTRAFTPCVPEHDELRIRWRDTQLPPLRIRGCDAYQPGVDAPLSADQLDLDLDGQQDGWAFTLGAPSDGPFPTERMTALWDDALAPINGSFALDPPPRTWRSGETLVVTCPAEGWKRITLTVNDSIIFRSITLCEEPPGEPLIDLEMVKDERELVLFLQFSRIADLDSGDLTPVNGTRMAPGAWETEDPRVLDCPGGHLVLRYDGRLAFRGPAPC